MSGNGQVVVGSSGPGGQGTACFWKKTTGGWSLPTALGILPGMEYSAANAVDFSATKAVGTSGFFDPLTGNYGSRPVRWSLVAPNTMEDLLPILAALYPAQGILLDDSWKLDAAALSGDGRIVAGRMNFPAPTALDPTATLDEGWIALVP